MTDSQALDGNAIAGTLAEVFGGDIAALRTYLSPFWRLP